MMSTRQADLAGALSSVEIWTSHSIDESSPLLSNQKHKEPARSLRASPADGSLWSGQKVAQWMQQRLGRPVAPQRGWEYLKRLGLSSRG